MGDTGDPIRERGECILLCLPGGLEFGGKGGSSSLGPLQSQLMLLQGQTWGRYFNVVSTDQQGARRKKQQQSLLLCRKRKRELLRPVLFTGRCTVSLPSGSSGHCCLPLKVHPTFSRIAEAGEEEGCSSGAGQRQEGWSVLSVNLAAMRLCLIKCVSL